MEVQNSLGYHGANVHLGCRRQGNEKGYSRIIDWNLILSVSMISIARRSLHIEDVAARRDEIKHQGMRWGWGASAAVDLYSSVR